MASVTGAVVAVRLGWGAPLWEGLAWYCGSFIGFHVVLAPFMAAWYVATDRIERWVRSIVEEELIRGDLRDYDRQMNGVLSLLKKQTGKDESP